MPKGGGRRAGSAKKNASFGGRIRSTFRGIVNYFRNLGGKVRGGRSRKPKGTSGRAGGSTSRRMSQSGRGGR